ncbi:MAG: DUF4041 domain-containing protein [Scytonema sp. CRU_2_7]|nr:DUF4041 domain-containing protein [Scytonema sp. CRU_2_7]
MAKLETQIKERQKESQQLDAKIYLQSVDAYEPQYDFIKSEDYLIQLQNIKLQQDRVLNSNRAFISRGKMIINGNEQEGEQLIKNFLKLIKIAFETQCDYAIRDVKYSNIENLKRKLQETFTKINKISSKTKCEIGREYLDLKLKHLDLKYELEQKRKEEREQEQEIKKQAREREK